MIKLPQNRGFSLLEVLIALVILSIAFISVFTAISSNSQTLLRLQNKTAANWVALNVIAEAQLGLIELTQSTEPIINVETMFGRDWYCISTLIEEENTGSYKINLEVKQEKTSPTLLHMIGYLRKLS